MLADDIKKQPTHSDTLAALRLIVQEMAGRKLPGERDLAVRLNVSRPRLRTVLATLQREGLVEPRQGSGTYAVDPQGERLRKVALLIDEDLKLADDPFFSLMMERLQANLRAAGIRCLVERSHGDVPHRPLEDGVLTLGLSGRAAMARQRPQDPPMVGLLLDTGARPGRRASVFQLDDREAGREAARALLRAGSREALFLGRHSIPASQERWGGAEEIAAAAGLRLRFVSTHLNYTDGVRLGREMELPAGGDLLGIITTNDWLAVGLHTGLHRRPVGAGPVKIVSFDGLPVTADPALGIESLAVPIDSIARDAVAELRRLHQSAGSVGRVVRYPLCWARHNDDAVAAPS